MEGSCEQCHGTGKCRACNGRGSLIVSSVKKDLTIFKRTTCEFCFGTGKCLACQAVTAERLPQFDHASE
jgi:DnaJ-class molecular chaperone